MSNCGNHKGRRAQVSIEFFALVGFLLIVFLALVIVIQQRSVSLVNENDVGGEQAIGDVIVRELRYAFLAGDGYARHFDLPASTTGGAYLIDIVPVKGAVASTIIIGYKDRPDISPVVMSVPQRLTYVGGQGNFPSGVTPPFVQNTQGRVTIYLPLALQGTYDNDQRAFIQT